MYYYWRDQDLYLQIRVTTCAKKTQIMGLYGEQLKIQVAATPVDGKANAKLIKFFSKHFQVPQKQIEILQGSLSVNKLLCIHNVKSAKSGQPYK